MLYLVLKVVDLPLLDTPEAIGFITRLFNLAHKFLLFFSQVLYASMHLLLVQFHLLVLLASYALRAVKALALGLELID